MCTAPSMFQYRVELYGHCYGGAGLWHPDPNVCDAIFIMKTITFLIQRPVRSYLDFLYNMCFQYEDNFLPELWQYRLTLIVSSRIRGADGLSYPFWFQVHLDLREYKHQINIWFFGTAGPFSFCNSSMLTLDAFDNTTIPNNHKQSITTCHFEH